MKSLPIDLPVTTYRILLAGDQLAAPSGAAEFLAAKGYRVYRSSPRANIGDIVAAQGIDILVLDVDSGSVGNVDVTTSLRSVFPKLGIISTSPLRRTEDKIASYMSGVDLHISQPLVQEELGAAIDALAHRLHLATSPTPTGELTLNPRTRELSGAAGKATLSQRDVSLLQAFSLAPDRMLESAQLARTVGLNIDEAGKASLEVQIVRLRKKIDRVSGKAPSGIIKSIRGIGYQLCQSIRILTSPEISEAHRAHSHA